MDLTVRYYFNHPHGGKGTLDNARAVELVLGLRYIDFVAGELVEVGAVTPYYVRSPHDCVDPTDRKANIKGFAQDYDYKNKNVLSISTVEHIGTGDYRLPKQKELAFEVLRKIHGESKSCLITWPIGYNETLDGEVKDNINDFNYFFYVKRSQEPLSWELVNGKEGFGFDYGSPFRMANSVMFISKGI